jgi:hypothetical protein
MIPFKIADKDVQIPGSWQDTRVGHYLELCKADTIDQKLRAISGFKNWAEVKDEEKAKLFPHLSWMIEEPAIKANACPALVWVEDDAVPIYFTNIGNGTWLQKREAQRALHKATSGGGTIEGCMVELLAIYLYPQVTGKPYRTAEAIELRDRILNSRFIPMFEYFLYLQTELTRIIERDIKYLSRNPDAKQTLAGVSRLERFKDWYSIDDLSGNDLLKQEAVLDMEYDVIFFKLWRDLERNEYTERLKKAYKQ